MPVAKGLTPAKLLATCLHTTTRKAEAPAFQYGLFPVRSPLLRESYSVSIPPLTYMLKFSG